MVGGVQLCIFAIFVLGLCIYCRGETSWPEERGLIITTYSRYYYYYWGRREPVQLRHLPVYPGYENITDDDIPGITFDDEDMHFESVDIDYRRKCIYLYDSHESNIVLGTGYSKDLDPENVTLYTMDVGVSKGAIQLAVDWLSHTVYWSDSVFRWIMAAPGQTDKFNKNYYRIIAEKHLEYPSGITLDPLSGYLFWSDNGKHPKIERSDMKGGSRHTIISKYAKSPSSLEADIFVKRLYWINSHTDSIMSSTYDGSDIITIQRITGGNLHDLATFRGLLYISDDRNSKLYTLNKTKGEQMGRQVSSAIKFSPENIYGLAIYGAENQPLKDKDYCADLDCDHLCVSTTESAECLCSEGYNSSDDNVGKCQESETGFRKAIVVANATHICLLDIRAFALTNFEYVCIFSIFNQSNETSSTVPSNTSTENMPNTSTESMPNTLTESMPTVTPATETNETTTPYIATGIGIITMFDVDDENRVLYIATDEGFIYERPIDLPIDNGAAEFLVAASGRISGLAYDYEDSNNLYWCESDTGSVRVINVRTRASREIVGEDDLAKPRDIIIIPEHRKLAMITKGRRYTYIRTVDMDGSDIEIVTRERQGIETFTFDNEYDMFYYISGRYIYSMDFDGNRVSSFYSREENPTNLVQYQNYLAFIYEEKAVVHIKVVDIHTWVTVRNGLSDGISMDIVEMKILGPNNRSLSETSPCTNENGGCSQICVTKYVNDTMIIVCECRLGYKLAEDNATCITSKWIEDDFILAVDSTNTEILQIDLKTNEISALLEPHVYSGIYYDAEKNKLIWSEYYGNRILSSSLNGSDLQVLAILGWYGYPNSFDKDLTTGNLYITSYRSYYISVLTPTGDYQVLNTGYWGRGRGDIVVHPGKGWLYFTAWEYSSSYIGRAEMDGQNEEELITGNQVKNPQGLAIDFINDNLYWSDSAYDTIQRCNLDGQSCVTIVNMTGTGHTEDIRDIVTDGEVLYYTAYRKDHIVRVNLTEPYNRTLIGQNPQIGKLETLVFYSSTNKNIQPESNSCRRRRGRGDCSTICFPTPRGRTCGCEDGIMLKDDERTCTNVYQCSEVIEQSYEQDITFARSCLRYVGEICRYRCPHNYQPNFDTLLTCTDNGWSLESEILCKEVKCPSTIPNGKLDTECKHEVGNACNFECNNGFVKSTDVGVCSDNGTYQIPEDEFCRPYRCSDEIEHGYLDETCTRGLGVTCNYSCNEYYSKTTKDIPLTCHRDGWSLKSISLCSESVCLDTSLSNGMIVGDCQRTIGSVCSIKCNTGYTNTTKMAVCNSDMKWHPGDSCARMECPTFLPNGNISSACNFAIGAICAFKCKDGFKAHSLHRNVTCGASGQWNLNPCREITCQDDILNGGLSPQCTRKVGENCDFVCNDGFVRASERAVCTQNGTFQPPGNGLCKPFKCNDRIENGKLADKCQRTVGNSCAYTCNEFYTPSVETMEVLCQANGWNPHNTVLCRESVCKDNSLTNGKIIGNCSRRIGETCMFRCNQGFVNITHVTVCQSDHLWHPRNICKAFKCEDFITNGKLSPDCTRTMGSSCKFSCDKYYSPKVQSMEITCGPGGWSSTDLCEESVCIDENLPHTQFSKNCSKKTGEVCPLQCHRGYVNTTDVAVCKSDYTWHPSKPCKAIECLSSVANGEIIGDCDLSIGTTCNFKCNGGFVMNELHKNVTCKSDGQWDMATGLCFETTCKGSTLPHGIVVANCKNTVGEACNFQCNDGYTNTTDVVVCNNELVWQPTSACSEIYCPRVITNGEITGTCKFIVGNTCDYTYNNGVTANSYRSHLTCNASGQWEGQEHICYPEVKCKHFIGHGRIMGACDFGIGHTCNYTCDEGYTAAKLQTSITCSADGQWESQDNVCHAVSVISEQVEDNGLSVPGVVSGITILGLLVIVLIVALVLIVNRRNFSTMRNAEYIHDSRHVAFENPGFLQSNAWPIDNSDLQPSTSYGVSHQQTALSEDADVARQINNEPLPAMDYLEVTGDTVVLTKDSWKHEREQQNSAEC